MKLREFGPEAARDWFQQIFEWSRNKVSFSDNLDLQTLTVSINTTETEVGHSLGRAPQLILIAATYPSIGTVGVSLTRPPEKDKVWLKASTAGSCTLLLI